MCSNMVRKGGLVPCCREPVRSDPRVKDIIPYYMIMLDKVRRMAPEFDVIRVHFDRFHFPVLSRHAHHTLTTLHGRQDLTELQQLYAAFPQMPLVSISNAQRAPIPNANFAATIHHGLPLDLFKLNQAPRGEYLSFLGRISPEKGIDCAIGIARAANLPLKIAAKVLDRDYFRDHIAPLLDPHAWNSLVRSTIRSRRRCWGNRSPCYFPSTGLNRLVSP
jgi:glycosyltransferase involved in cell wall biosynthesis